MINSNNNNSSNINGGDTGLILRQPAPLIQTHDFKALKEKFQKYLTLLFHDLCAKTNGLSKKEIDEYTFLKVSQIY